MIVIGVDAGASTTRVAVWRNGDRLAIKAGQGAAIRPDRVLHSSATIAGIVKSTLAQVGLTRGDVLVVGAAGAGRAAEAEGLRTALRGEYIAERVIVTSDVALALRALPPGPGIVLLAGTGSIAVARLPDGTTAQQGGHGWQMGDEGSGYWIGRQALVAIGRARDGRGPVSGLDTALPAAVGASEFRDLVGWTASAGPREVAALAATVVRVAEEGDPVAKGIVERAAGELTTLVTALASRIATPSLVGLGGGLLGADRLLRGLVETALRSQGLSVHASPIEPLDGARSIVED